MRTSEIRRFLEEKRAIVEKAIDRYFPKGGNYGKRVLDAALYSLKAGGKRLRPILCLMGYELYKPNSEDILPFACGLECIHTYSLIHDDLPSMDDDDLRRGKPSCHKAFDEATAILAGDGLLTLAFELFTHQDLIKRVNPSAVIQAINKVAKAVGLKGMVGGQMADLLAEGKRGSLKKLQWIHEHKTVAFIEASLISGAILASAPKDEINILSRFGNKLGLIFQIVDDLLDLIGDEKTLGKPIKSDLKRQKLTYPSILGIEETKRITKDLTNEALSILEPLGERAKLLKDLTSYLSERMN